MCYSTNYPRTPYPVRSFTYHNEQVRVDEVQRVIVYRVKWLNVDNSFYSSYRNVLHRGIVEINIKHVLSSS
jgi:hypothetical protein